LEHVPRTRVFHLRFVSPHGSWVARHLCVPAPRLESLRLVAPTRSAHFTLPESAFDGQTPQLRRIELRYCKFSWDAPLFSRLNHLGIYGPVVRPTMAQIIAVLDKMPLLHTLILQNACPAAPEKPMASHVNRMVHFSKLFILDLRDGISYCTNLLSRLSYPATSAVRLRCTGWAPTDNNWEDIFLLIVSTGGWGKDAKCIRCLFVDYDRVDSIRFRGWISGSRYPSALATTTAQLDLRLSFEGVSSDTGLIERPCKALPLTHLQTLHINDTGLDENRFLDTFRGSTMLRSLSVCGKYASGLLKALGPNVADKNAELVFPQLRILILNGVYFDEADPSSAGSSVALQACTESRFSQKIALEELLLEDCRYITTHDVEQLEQLVDRVVWDGVYEESTDDWDDDSE
jgi:hypothetical protein